MFNEIERVHAARDIHLARHHLRSGGQHEHVVKRERQPQIAFDRALCHWSLPCGWLTWDRPVS